MGKICLRMQVVRSNWNNTKNADGTDDESGQLCEGNSNGRAFQTIFCKSGFRKNTFRASSKAEDATSGMWMINLCGKMKISIRLEENRDDSTTVLKDGDLQVLKKCNGWIDAYSSTTTLACEKMELGMRIAFKYCEKTMEREGLCNACESKLSGQSWNGSNASCDDKRICHKDG